MKIKTEDFVRRCNCRSVGECNCNTFSEMDALEALVKQFSKVMLSKLKQKLIKDGYAGWDSPKQWSRQEAINCLEDHVEKNDMVDVANFAMLAWNFED